MFKIGDFSKLSKVTVKALRYYDEIGLLKPARVDDFTGYRYYSAVQLPRLNRILALKDLGFSLDQLARLLDDDLPPEQIRGMLRMRQAELEQKLETERERLARVEARLRQIEQEGKMPAYDVVLKKTEAVTVAAVRDVIPTYSDVDKLFGELFAHLGQKGIGPAGPPMALYHDEEFKERDVDAEIAVPLSEVVPGSERVSVRELPAVETMATAIHRGSYQTIGDAYTALMQWIETNGYHVADSAREVYLQHEEGSNPSTWVTEVQFPVERA
jgi:effector-binding domain-containing protein